MRKNPTTEQIEYMAQIHKAVAEQVDLSKPLPQEVDVPVKFNLVCKQPQKTGMICI